MADVSTSAAIARLLRDRRNWGRWGDDDQRGAVNLITDAKRREAVQCVRSGQTLSLSRPFPTQPGPGNPVPAQHFTGWAWHDDGTTGYAYDHYGTSYHGFETTHIDALCHLWDQEGMWGGRDPAEHLAPTGAGWGDIDQWGQGIVTRGVLLDVPGHRGVPFVTLDSPVTGEELGEIALAEDVDIGPGDALVVHSGRQAWEQEHGHYRAENRPGLDASCLAFVRDHDIAMVIWDFLDQAPSGIDIPWTVHAALVWFGVALVDNARLDALAKACGSAGSYDFMVTVAPLRVEGGTGSPVNPIALL